MTVAIESTQHPNLLVRTPDAKLLALRVPAAAQVAELKARLAMKTGVASGRQYLLFNSKPLRDQATLAVYGLGGDDAVVERQPPTVTLCVRQKGGCFIVSFTILTILFFATVCAPLTCGTSLLLWVFLAPPLLILPFFCL